MCVWGRGGVCVHVCVSLWVCVGLFVYVCLGAWSVYVCLYVDLCVCLCGFHGLSFTWIYSFLNSVYCVYFSPNNCTLIPFANSLKYFSFYYGNKPSKT